MGDLPRSAFSFTVSCTDGPFTVIVRLVKTGEWIGSTSAPLQHTAMRAALAMASAYGEHDA